MLVPTLFFDCVWSFMFFVVVANARGSRGTNQGLTAELGTATGRCLTNWVHPVGDRQLSGGALSLVIDQTWFHVFARTQTPGGILTKVTALSL